MRINLRIWLKIPDAEAATVKNTLVRRMGFEGVIDDVSRERLYSIEADVGNPWRLAKHIVRELVNENKEECLVSISDLELDDGYVPVKVGLHIEDGEAISTRNRLVHRLGLSAVKGVERSNIWKLYIRSDDREAIADEIARKLLINPNKDSYEILRARARAVGMRP